MVVGTYRLPPNTSPPSLHPHYKDFITTTKRSATDMDIDTFYLACLRFQYFLLAFHADFSRSSQEPVARSCLLYTAHPTVSKQVSSVVIPTTPKLIGFDVTYFLLTIPHRRFTCVHLLATYLAVLNGTTFNHRSPPIGFPHSSMKRFAIRACTPSAVGLLPSLVKLRMKHSSDSQSWSNSFS